MRRYEEYKDSGVQWLGEIPGHWDLVPFKSCFWLEKGLSITKADLVEDGVPVISYGQIHSKKNIYTKVLPELKRFVPNFYIESFAQCLVNNEDFVFADTSEDTIGSGNFVRIDNDDTIFAGYHTIIGRNKKREYGHYLSYLFQSSCWRSQIWTKVQGVKLFSISRSILNSTKIVIPPLSEQQAIVSFLDAKTSQIDTYIAGKEKEIDLLKSTKQRIIADAVTKGITPGVEMKESGIAWVGKIPAHWKVQKLKTIVEERKVKNKGNIETNVLSLSYGNIIRKKNVNAGLCPDDYSTYQIVEPGNIILRLTDLQNDHRSLRTGLVLEKGIITSAYLCLQTTLDPFYLQQILHSYDLMKVFYTMGDGLRQSMSYKDVCSLSIPIAPVEEQRSIVAHIKEKTEAIDSAIEKLTNQIELMKKYKQRLICDVVTGQIKVC